MKWATIGTTLLGSYVAAFPTMDALTAPLVHDALAKLETRQLVGGPQGDGFLPAVAPPFDAEAQHVRTDGQYTWMAPGPNDMRGECPGLNAMANHGYLPRNGRATIAQFINATETVFGMANDLGAFLGAYGAIADGDGTSWSIGGVPHTGILGSHNNYEADSSPLKSDLNQYGTNGKLIIEQFQNLYNRQPHATKAEMASSNYNLEVLRDFRASRFNESVAKNPYFTYLPFTGVLVSQAAFTFIYRFMANKSMEYPEGVLNANVLKSFMSISGPDNNLKWTPGHERIPDNWYKRNKLDEYGQNYFQSDVNQFVLKYPFLAEVGCNAGKVNSYNTIDASTLSGGAYTASSAAANPVCFGVEYAVASLPKFTGLSASRLASLIPALNKALAAGGLSCATIAAVNTPPVKSCPGFMGFYGGPTGPVAKGAIQS